jgi:hypothetical protein
LRKKNADGERINKHTTLRHAQVVMFVDQVHMELHFASMEGEKGRVRQARNFFRVFA